jgi:hypothetical protein
VDDHNLKIINNMIEQQLQKQRKDSFVTFLNLMENNLMTDEVLDCWNMYEIMVNTSIFCGDALKQIEEGTLECDEDYKQAYVEDMHGSYHAANEFNEKFHTLAKAIENHDSMA